MNKKQLLKKIKEIITEIGYTTTGDMQLDHSPLYGTLGPNITALVEGLGINDVRVVVYHNDNEIDTIYVDYEKLEDIMDKDQIEYMYESLLEYQKIF